MLSLRYTLLSIVLIAIGFTSAQADDAAAKPFPVRGILPKHEIGALRLLAKHPQFDGRGVVVAIFDTGVDPGAAGLQTTTDGKPKVIDMIDGTGSGDVATTTRREPQKGKIEGLTGRTLTLDRAWLKPGRKFHVGMKAAYDFFPGGLVSRLKRERRKKFDAEHHKIETKLRRALVKWDLKHAKPSTAQRRKRAELSARLDQLAAALKNYDDPGPMFDCVVFHDGTHWRAAIDTDEDGDLRDEKALTNFRTERKFGTFGKGASLNFAANIFDQGRRLSIVVDCTPHGTHVAGIVAGHYPDQPERNGIAPGAQIVSIKIGDTRLGSMETGAGLVRGAIAAVRNKCDVVNMSYGEMTTAPNRGRLTDVFTDLVDKHNIVFVAAAGNDGPALSTVIAPGGTTSAVLGVGAYLSPEMMAAQYTLRKRLPEMPYTWSSRGPAADGALGVDVFAPGGAIAPVSNSTLAGSRQMNGTSMASPNAAGAVALLVSALKQSGRSYSPYSIRQALQNTARRVPAIDPFTQGAGLIQVDRAWKYLAAEKSRSDHLLRLELQVGSGTQRRGVYLREPHQLRRLHEARVRVQPVFRETTSPKAKIAFEMRLTLSSTADWVEVGEHLLLSSAGASIEVAVDPRKLSPGVHYAEVRGHDAKRPDRGPVLRLPITVMVPTALGKKNIGGPSETLDMRPGQIARRFITVPDGATWFDLRLRLNTPETSRRFVIHTVRRQGGGSLAVDTRRQYVTLQSGTETVRSIPVSGGMTLELCLAQFWSSLGPSKLSYDLKFHGLTPDRQILTLLPGEAAARVEVASALDRQVVAPSAKLTTLRTSHRPTSSTIRPLDAVRDRLPDGRQIYQLVLTYEFDQPTPGKVTPRFPMTDGLLYESPFGTQLWSIFDAGKRRVASDDISPRPVSLGKGKHTLRFQLRHTDAALLETQRDAIMVLDRPLAKPISLRVYSSLAALAHRQTFSSRTLSRGQRGVLFVAPPGAKQIAASVGPGDVLLGTIHYGKADVTRSPSGMRPGGFDIRYVAGVGASRQAKQPGDSATPPQALRNRVRDVQIEHLKQLGGKKNHKQFERLATKLLKQYPGHLPILVARLVHLDTTADRKGQLPQVIAAADAVLAQIDREQLALHFGTDIDSNDAKAVAQRKQFTAHRETLIDTLYRKGRALGYMELPEVIQKHPIADAQAHDASFEANFAELARWVETTDAKYFLLHVRRERRQGRYGQALAVLNKHIPTSAPNYWHYKKRRDLYELLGWKHLWEQEKRRLVIRFRSQHEPF